MFKILITGATNYLYSSIFPCRLLKNEICTLLEAYQFLMPESQMYFPIWYNVVMVNKAYFLRYTHLPLRDAVRRLVADLDLMSVTSVNVIAMMT